jgi:hypothetical protein
MKLPETITDSQRQDDLDFDQYLYEVFLNDHIENEILRLMEDPGEKTLKNDTTLPIINANHSLV